MAAQASWHAAATNREIAARNAALSAQAGAATLGSEAEELLAQAKLLRDIFGDRIQHDYVDPCWLTSGVVKLAQAIYDLRGFERMPELADELKQAGCASEAILSHCRMPGPHVRGCWVVGDTAFGGST